MTEQNRERLAQCWKALRQACFNYHQLIKTSTCETRICACGSVSGGSDACTMLAMLELLITTHSPESTIGWNNDLITELKGIV